MTAKAILFLFILFTCTGTYAQSERQINNIIAFTKLYGYIKYFHPSDEAAKINWDKLAIHGVRLVENCKTDTELKERLLSLFTPIAPTLKIYEQNKKVKFEVAELIPSDVSKYKPVAWQHLGLGSGGKDEVYHSARTNRLRKFISRTNYPVYAYLSSKDYANQEFRLSANAKYVEGSGYAYMSLANYASQRKPGTYYNSSKSPIKDTTWRNYMLNGTIDKDADSIRLAFLFAGDGEVWWDDLKFEIKNGDVWKQVYSHSFTDDAEGKALKSMRFIPNLFKDGDLIVQSDGKNKWLKLKKDAETVPHDTLFGTYPSVGEVVEKEIGSGLKLILPIALYGNEEGTFPVTNKIELKKLHQLLTSIHLPAMTGNDLYTRLANVAITWNVFQHFFPYFDVAKTNWTEDLRQAIVRAYTDKNETDFQKTLQLLTAKLKDGHISVTLTSANETLFPPIEWEWVEGKLLVTHVFDSAIDIQRGDIIKAVNKETPEEYFRQIYPFISAATKGSLEYAAKVLSLVGEIGTQIEIEIEGKSDKFILNRSKSWSERYNALKHPDSIKSVGADIMYINLSNASLKQIENSLPQLQKSKAIILDLRGYPNGNHQFISYLLKQDDTSASWMRVPKIIYPDQEKITDYGKYGWKLKAKEPHLSAKIILLTNARAISYSESWMSFIEHYKLATVVGQPSAGTNGNVNITTLPGGYSIAWTGMLVKKHDGSQHHGVGIIPHVLVKKTIKGIRENRDEFLEKAIEVANKK